MKYIIIKSENFNEIEKVQELARVDIEKRYKVDQFDNYANGSFAVIGEDALQMFRKKYGFTLQNYAQEFKTDGKTTAKVIPYITPSYYYDARNGGRGGLTDVFEHDAIDYLIEFEGVLFTYYRWDRNGGTVSLYLFNDQTDYNKYLPYNWKDEHPAPQKVGTLTDKKLSAWKEWLLNRKAAAEAEKARRGGNVADFRARLSKVRLSDCKDYRLGENSGYFVKNGLRYSYTITNDGYIREDIKTEFITGDKLDAFIKMSKGNF